jgi:hypothetical protein
MPELKMSIEKFDPYGLVLPANARGEDEPPKAVSILLSRVGQGVFWLLVILIVASRIAYFSSDYPLHSVDVQQASSGITR